MKAIEKEVKNLESKILDALNGYRVEKIQTDKDIEETVLYFVDKKCIDTLLNLSNEFNKEILCNKKDGMSDDTFFLKYGFQKHCKILNSDLPAHSYSISIEKKWKHVKDSEKVYARLDEEFEVWKNAYRAKTVEKLSAVKAKNSKEILAEVDRKIAETRKKHEWIKENFDRLKVVISSRDRSKEYATIYFYIKGGVGDRIKIVKKKNHLDIHRPNVLWFKKSENISHGEFLKIASNPFGDVYYLEN